MPPTFIATSRHTVLACRAIPIKLAARRSGRWPRPTVREKYLTATAGLAMSSSNISPRNAISSSTNPANAAPSSTQPTLPNNAT